MAPRLLVPAVLLIGAMAATPALAQRARQRGENGGNRGGSSEARRGDGGGARAVPRSPNASRSSDRPQPSEARASSARSYQPRPEARASTPNVAVSRGYQARGDQSGGYQTRGDNGRSAYANRAYGGDSYGKPYANQHHAVPRPYYSYKAPYYSHRPPAYYSRYPYAYNRYYVRPYYYPRYVYPHVVTVYPYQPYYYRPQFSIGVYYGLGGAYPYGPTPSSYYDPAPGRSYGGIRITDAPREAQVFADGYYVGIVDDFDGAFQHVNLEAGEHQIEIRAPGLAPIAFDVVVQPGRTITLRADIY